MKSSLPLFIASLGLLAVGAAASHQGGAPARKIVFGRDVMPILGQRCFKCHGPDAATVAAGLRLDSLEAASKVITPGMPEKSHLMVRIMEKDPENRMPPPDSGVKPLTEAEIETLREWIRQGAKYEKHWAFQTPTLPALPAVKDAKWAKNDIDRFVLAKLEEAGMKPEPEADRDTLALRAAQTLTGLPPTATELEAFRKDAKPGAYERYVDRLLTKPSYGEHAARYWLDAVRYGDTHGLQLDNERGIFPYRDWVVRALNQDLSFPKFIEWQLAGDLLPNPTTEQLIATGYIRSNLTSAEGGAIEEEFLARNTFDRVETTSTVMLGLTIGCARCHDHKYDPIKQSNYYGLYAFFNSTTDKALDGNELLPAPTIKAATPEDVAKLATMDRELQTLRKAVNPEAVQKHFATHKEPVPTGRDWQISPVYERTSFPEAFGTAEAADPTKMEKVEWKPVALEFGKDLTNIIGKPNSSVYIKGTVGMTAARKITFGVSSDDGIKVWLNGKLIHSNQVGRGLNTAIDRVTGEFRKGDNELVLKIVNVTNPDGVNLRLFAAPTLRLQDVEAAKKRSKAEGDLELQSVYLEVGPDTPSALKYRKLVEDRAKLEASIPMSLIAREMSKPRETFILKRGEYTQKGDPVTRHIPPILGELPTGAPKDRLGFAQWLTAPSNPLVTRVFVNRVWQQHFGTAIVKTAEDFGTQGEWPLNQPLLDYLAVSFVKDGGSMKKLHRMIVTSAAFRQSSKITGAKLEKDPENRLISRGPRFRLDAEVIRDKALFAAGLLLEKQGGRGFKPYQPDGIWENASDPASGTHFYYRDKDESIYRRSMYLFWKRTAPPPAMITLDAPLRDTCVVRRSTTNTPLQALTIQNEPAFLEAARVMAEQVLSAAKDDEKRFAFAYRSSMARPPRPEEIAVLKRALAEYRKKYQADPAAAKRLLAVGDAPQSKTIPAAEQAAWLIICSTLMNTDEFLTQH